jgi:Uma2 family endonuclease
MATLVLDSAIGKELQARRRRTGADRHDEVWDGVYVMSPLPNDEHQELVALLTAVFMEAVGWQGLADIRPGVNVSDRLKNWKSNYRAPDVVAFLKNTKAVNHGEFWLGGPDFVVEIISPGDRSRQKIDFYSKLAVTELLLIDRKPWSLELYRLVAGKLELVGNCSLQEPATLTSEVLALSFSLKAGRPRPRILVKHLASKRTWRL